MRSEVLFQRWLTDDIVLDERAYEPNGVQPPHADGVDRWSVVLGGRMSETAGSVRAWSAPFRVFVKRPNAVHANQYGPEGARIFSVISLRSGGAGAYAHLNDGRLLGALLALRTMARAPSPSVTRARRLVHSLAERSSEGSAPATLPPWWEDAQPLFEHAAIHSESVPRLAERIGVHPVHLNRVCQRVHRRSTCAQLRWLRAQRAAQLLSQGGGSIARAACEAGFCDQAHLTRVLRAEIGLSPLAYQRAVGVD